MVLNPPVLTHLYLHLSLTLAVVLVGYDKSVHIHDAVKI